MISNYYMSGVKPSSIPPYRARRARVNGSARGNAPGRRAFRECGVGDSEQQVQQVQQNQPSFAELAAALKSLQQPIASEKSGLERHVTTIIVAACLGIGAWVLSGLNSVQTTLSRVDATMTTIQATVQDTSRRVDTLTGGQADVRAQQAILSSRVDALEKRSNPK